MLTYFVFFVVPNFTHEQSMLSEFPGVNVKQIAHQVISLLYPVVMLWAGLFIFRCFLKNCILHQAALQDDISLPSLAKPSDAANLY